MSSYRSCMLVLSETLVSFLQAEQLFGLNSSQRLKSIWYIYRTGSWQETGIVLSNCATLKSKMTVSTFLSAINTELSKEAKVHSDPNTKGFKEAHERWTDRDLKFPSAIVVVATEDDIVKTVRTPPSPMSKQGLMTSRSN